MQPRADRSRLERLFNEALRRRPEERAEFARQACAKDEQLRRELESLLEWDAGSDLSRTVPALKSGDRLGNFEIIGPLGKGGMGEVYRARDLRLKREVAIKVLPQAFAADRARVARFEREARAASALNHPNIVAVHDVGQENDVAFIVSELVQGETLSRLMEPGPFPVRKIVDIGGQIAAGLAAAHSAGVIHRDLKPGNVMVGPDGRVKILDLGLAARERVAAEGDSTAEISGPGIVMGTPGYMSPEQVRAEAVDARSDLFSLGVILYEMAAGHPAFRGDSSIERMNAVLKDEPADLPETLPAALGRIVRRCLEKDRTQRFQCAADLRFALESVAVENRHPAQATPRRRWPLWVAAAAGLSAGALLTTLLWVRTQSSSGTVAPNTTLRPLTNDVGLTTDATISQDGKLVAYASDRSDASNLDIWVQQVETGSAVRITDDPADDSQPAISPDGSQIAFRSERGGGGIYSVPTIGGQARLLVPNGRGPRFSPKGDGLLYFIGPAHNLYEAFALGQLYMQPLAGGPAREVAPGCGVFGLSLPGAWSPAGDRIAFDGQCNARNAIYVFDLNGHRVGDLDLAVEGVDQWLANPPRLLAPSMAPETPFADVAERRAITVTPVSPDGAHVAGTTKRMIFGTGGEQHASASADGRLMALSVVGGEQHTWGIPIDANGHPSGESRRLRPAGGSDYFAHITRDGRWLLYSIWRGGRLAMYLRDLKGGTEREIPWTGKILKSALTLEDGSGIAYTAADDGMEAMYEVPARGGIPRRLRRKESEYFVYDWTTDGSTLLFCEGGPKVNTLDLSTGAEGKLLDDPEYATWQVHLSPDNHWITFVAVRDDLRVYVAPFRKGLVRRNEWMLVAHSGVDDKPFFSSDGRTVLFASDRDGYRCIWGQPLGPDMHPSGAAFAVYHAHERRRSLRNIPLNLLGLGVGGRTLVFPERTLTGNVWLLEPLKPAAH